MNLSRMTRNLGDKLPGDEMQETGPYVNDHEYRSIPSIMTEVFRVKTKDNSYIK